MAVELRDGAAAGRQDTETRRGGDKERKEKSEIGRAWSLKRLHRLILRSAVYRQESRDNPRFAAVDSGNQYLWRMNRPRLAGQGRRGAGAHVSGERGLTGRRAS